MITQVTRNQNTILLKASKGGHHDEGIVGAAFSPGMAVRLQAAGNYVQESMTAANAAGRGTKIVKENALIGKTPADAYTVVGETFFFYSPMPGDHLNLLIKTGQTLAVGDFVGVEGGGSGKFIIQSAAAGGVGRQYEVLESTGGALAADALIRCRCL